MCKEFTSTENHVEDWKQIAICWSRTVISLISQYPVLHTTSLPTSLDVLDSVEERMDQLFLIKDRLLHLVRVGCLWFTRMIPHFPFYLTSHLLSHAIHSPQFTFKQEWEHTQWIHWIQSLLETILFTVDIDFTSSYVIPTQNDIMVQHQRECVDWCMRWIPVASDRSALVQNQLERSFSRLQLHGLFMERLGVFLLNNTLHDHIYIHEFLHSVGRDTTKSERQGCIWMKQKQARLSNVFASQFDKKNGYLVD